MNQNSNEKIVLTNGAMTRAQLDSLLNTLPVDINFIDATDEFIYFNASRILSEPSGGLTKKRAALGQSVQKCHPTTILSTVNEMLEAFHAGSQSKAVFWYPKGTKLIHIQYFAVRNTQGEYLGCLEVIQDILPFRQITGERRKLTWDTK